MKIAVKNYKWASTSHKRAWAKLAKHAMEHYPKDSDLAKAIRGSFEAMEDCHKKWEKAHGKTMPARKPAKKTTAKRRTTPKRRTTMKRATPKRRTASKTTAKRRTMSKRATPKRRTMARRRWAA
jgi:hypothetical protein